MRKALLVLMTFLTLGVMKSYSQMYHEGNFVGEIYIGFPNAYSLKFKERYTNYNSEFDPTSNSSSNSTGTSSSNSSNFPIGYTPSNFTNVTTSGFGPIGIRFEYLISKRIGVGVNFNYANTYATATITETTDNMGNPLPTPQSYSFNASAPRWRLMPSFFFHIGNSKKWDPYLSAGLGYASGKMIENTTDSSFYNNNSRVTDLTFLNIAVRAEIGLRYFFTNHLGAHLQLGLGSGPLMALGISTKF